MRQVKVNSVIGSPIITLQEAKDFLRVEDDTDDYIITRMIDSATEWCENYLSKDIVSKSRTYYQEYVSESFTLYYAPVSTVTSVTSNGSAISYTEQGLDDVIIDLSGSFSNVKVDYETTGLTDSVVKDAVLSLIGAYYDFRGDFIMNTVISIPTGVKSKLDSKKKMWF